MSIAIVTDSTSDLTAAEAERYGLTIVPLYVMFGETSFRDGVDIGPREFFEKMAAEKQLPRTSQPAEGDFLRVFEDLLQRHDAVVGLFISGELSGTARAAESAARSVDGRVVVIDTRMTEWALGAMAIEAGKMARTGASVEDIAARMDAMRDRLHVYFVVDSFDHLRRGGRIGGAAALMGSLLQIKPVLELKDGRVEVAAKIRTKKRAWDYILDALEQDVRDLSLVNIGVIHAAAPAEGEELRVRVRARVAHAQIRLQEIGPILGVHTGPGVVGLIYYAE